MRVEREQQQLLHDVDAELRCIFSVIRFRQWMIVLRRLWSRYYLCFLLAAIEDIEVQLCLNSKLALNKKLRFFVLHT